MNARDVIAVAIHCSSETAFAEDIADAILADLSSDGYRILAKDELDDPTLEAAAKVAANHRGFNFKGDKGRTSWRLPTKHDIAAAIRNLRSAG